MSQLNKEELIIRCAYLFYKEKLSIKDVSSRLHISRFKVSRYLKDAEDLGIIDIRIVIPDLHAQKLAMDIEKKFNISQAIVVPVSSDMSSDMVRVAIGRKGAELLKGLKQNIGIGISWGRTIANMVEELPEATVKFERISELTGGFGMISPKISTSSLAPLLAQKTDALCYQMHGPIIASNAEIATSIMAEKSLNRTMEMSEKSDIAIFGVATMTNNSMFYCSGLMDEHELMKMRQRGAVGSVLGRFFDARGNEIDTIYKNSSISISWDKFLQIPERIALIGGREKAVCAYSLLAGGIITTIIMDNELASELIEEEESPILEKGR